MKNRIFIIVGIIIVLVISVILIFSVFQTKASDRHIKQYDVGERKYTDEEHIESLKSVTGRLIEDENEVVAYVNGEAITGKDFNIQLLHDAIRRLGEEITDEVIIRDISRKKIIEAEAKKYGVTISESRYKELAKTAEEKVDRELESGKSIYPEAGISRETLIMLQIDMETELEYGTIFTMSVLIQKIIDGEIATKDENVNDMIENLVEANREFEALPPECDYEVMTESLAVYTTACEEATTAYINYLVEIADIEMK